MSDPAAPPAITAPPRLPMAVLRALLPRAERDEVLADLAVEYAQRAARRGAAGATRWLWGQTLRSAPALLRWSAWRGWTGFEPPANAYRPGGPPMLKSWITDARYAARRLWTRPTYSVLAVLTLALGIGGTAAVFGIARPLILEPLPYAHEREVGVFWMHFSWSEQELLYLRGRFPGFRSVAGYTSGDATLREGDAPARLIPGLASSYELFDVLGATPLLGRTFRAGDDTRGAEPVVVLSYGLWHELGGSPSIVGTRITLDGTPRTVVGVMPRGFWFPDPSVRLWRPTPLDPENTSGNYTFIGRVAPGVDVHHMEGPLAQLTRMLGERFQYPVDWDKTKNAAVAPLRDEVLGTMRPALLATMGAMALILLIACAYVAALLLGQVDARSGELALRSALGANRGRLTRQLVVEALLIALVAGTLGAALATGGFGLLARALPLGAWAEAAAPDWTLFAAAFGLALAAALLVVLVPSVSLWRGDLRGALGRIRTGGLAGRGGRLENALVVVEVALAVLIASGAALLVRSVAKLYAIDPGVHAEGVAVVDVVFPPELTTEMRRRTIAQLAAALAEVPGVRATGATQKLPLRGGGNSFGIRIEGRQIEQATTFYRIVTPGYLETLGIPLRDGRTITAADRTNAEPVVVINEALAKKYFPGENPLGRRLGGGFGPNGWARIVGVVGTAAEGALTDEPAPARYFSAEQLFTSDQEAFVLRTAPGTDPASVLDAARRTVNRVAPSVAVQGVTTMSRVLDTAVGPARQIMMLLSLLTGLALVLGAVGIYGVISHFAARRKRDWAIKVALGLPAWRVVSSIVGKGVALVALGIVFGLGGAALLARLLSSFLFGVGALDAVAFAAASAALLAVGVAAAFVPARRTGTVSPAVILREQ
jgi:predicted permease